MLPNKSYTPSVFLNLFWRHRWLVIAPLVVCLLVALIVSSSLADRFQSDMLIQIIPQRVPDSYVRSTVTIRTEDRLDVVSQQVTSRTQLEEMIREFDLFPRERARLPMETVVDSMRSNISVELVRSARNEPVDAFHVKFTYGDPDVATKVTQRLGTLYIDRNFRDRGALAQATNEFMKVQLQEAAARLQEQEIKVARFREQHAGRLPLSDRFEHAGDSGRRLAAPGAGHLDRVGSRSEDHARASLQRRAGESRGDAYRRAAA